MCSRPELDFLSSPTSLEGENHRSLADIWVLLLQPPFSFAAFFFSFAAFCAIAFLKKFSFLPFVVCNIYDAFSYFSGFPYSFNIYA